jgi:tetratricopeptide (TPR) repeat protein
MKKMTFTGLALSLLIAAGAPNQHALRPEGEHASKGETVTNPDAEPQVREPLDLGMHDPSDLPDGDAIRSIRQFVGTPWQKPESREGLVLSVDTAEGQLYLACLYARAFFIMRPDTAASQRPAAKVGECCQRALALKPGYAEAYIVMAQGLRILRRYKDAEAALERAIALRPDWVSSYCQLAYVLVDQERYSDALAASQQEIRLSQQDGVSGRDDGYRGPVPMHSEKNDILRLDQIQFKMEHPNDAWPANERIRALHLNHDPVGWLNPDNDPK